MCGRQSPQIFPMWSVLLCNRTTSIILHNADNGDTQKLKYLFLCWNLCVYKSFAQSLQYECRLNKGIKESPDSGLVRLDHCFSKPIPVPNPHRPVFSMLEISRIKLIYERQRSGLKAFAAHYRFMWNIHQFQRRATVPTSFIYSNWGIQHPVCLPDFIALLNSGTSLKLLC